MSGPESTQPRPALHLAGVHRRFRSGDSWLSVLRGVDLVVEPGEVVALIGPSGAGKSTLLQISGLLEQPDAGQVLIDGYHAADLGDRERTRLRREHLGFVYQYHHLLPEFSALENVAMPLRIAGASRKMATDQARILLERVGLGERLEHRPAQLSGGEQQRVAICRGIANGPRLLLADEPTGNLDPATADTVFRMLLEVVRETGLAALIATHNPGLTTRMDRAVRLQNGVLIRG